jgi:hypothetical protein
MVCSATMRSENLASRMQFRAGWMFARPPKKRLRACKYAPGERVTDGMEKIALQGCSQFATAAASHSGLPHLAAAWQWKWTQLKWLVK